MTVKLKRKVPDKPKTDMVDLDLTPELKQVRDAITNLPEDDEMVNDEDETGNSGDEGTGSSKAKKKAKKNVGKEGSDKGSEKPKAAKKTKSNGSSKNKDSDADSGDQVTLGDICEEYGVEAHLARRALRTSDIEPPSGRWTWPKKHKDLKEVRNIVKGLSK